MMTIDTSSMSEEVVAVYMPAEAATEIGADDPVDTAAPEGFAIALIAVVAGILVLAKLVHVVVTHMM